MNGEHYVLRVHFIGRAPRELRYELPRIKIGRDGGDIVLGDPQASAVHCEVEFGSGLVTVRDLGSSNGTHYRGRRMPQFSLTEGESFVVGNTTIELVTIASEHKVAGGKTMMAEGHDLQALLSRAGADQAEARAGQGNTAPTAPGAANSRSGSSPGRGVAIGVVAVLLLGAVGGAGYYFTLGPGQAMLATNASAGDETGGETGEASNGETGATLALNVDPEASAETGGAELVEAGEPEDKDLGEIYREVGAATVVVRVPGSVGSGAIVDPSGVVLTNHHVIDGGKKEDLKVKVTVVLGKFDEELRAFEPDPAHLDAHVIAIDEDHDLALVRIDEPPDGLPHLALAEEPPFPGQRVAAIGHAGAGMLWAIKGGEVSATGSLTGHTDLQVQAKEIDSEETIKRLRSVWLRKGRTIQSTAKILPGDSGGPLVNMQGEIVGVNAFGKLDERTNQWLSFHVHHEEVSQIMADIPDRPLDVFPDPYSFGLDGDNALEDKDFDGKAESLLLSNEYVRPGRAVLVDLDQDGEYEATKDEEKLAELVDEGQFDAEFAVVVERFGRHHYWYDRDGDDAFDLYVVDDTGGGSSFRAYQLSADAPARKLSGTVVKQAFDASPFGKPEYAGRFNAVIPTIFDDVKPSGVVGRPDPLAAADARFTLKDYDGDGTPETIEQRDSLHGRVFIDADQSDFGTLEAESLGDKVPGNDIGAEVVAVVQGNNAWVWYDTDGDGSMDLVLHARDRAAGVATSAHRLDGDEPAGDATAGAPAPEFVGQRLVRPELVGSGRARVARAGGQFLGSGAVAQTEGANGLGAFPGLVFSDFAHILMHALEGKDNAIAEVTDRGFEIALFDLDADTFDGEADTAQAATVVKRGKFDAEVVLVTHADLSWAFYDTDADGKLDRVRFASLGTNSATHGYTVAAGKASADPGIKGKSIVDPALLPAGMKSALEAANRVRAGF